VAEPEPLLRADERGLARKLWQAFEAVHAVTYFHPECRSALVDAGAKGFWMGYFVGRLSPLGLAGAPAATAVCFGFAPRRVERAIPDGWGFVQPSRALEAREKGAASALRSCGVPEPEPRLLEGLERLVGSTPIGGRPLGAANALRVAAAARPGEPFVRLWQAATALRELRGDAHVALWCGAGIDGCEANVLTTAVHGQDDALLREPRGWTEDEWSSAQLRLTGRGLLDGSGLPTGCGRKLHADIEAQTDEIAATDYRRAESDPEEINTLVDQLRPIAASVIATGLYPSPNPMGLPLT
jgi:hypothetical protein